MEMHHYFQCSTYIELCVDPKNFFFRPMGLLHLRVWISFLSYFEWTNIHQRVIYLWRKVVCLFCFVCTHEIHQTGMLQITFLVSLESSQRGWVPQLGSMTIGLVVQKFLNIEYRRTCSAKVLENWMISSLKIKIVAKNLRGIGMCFWCC